MDLQQIRSAARLLDETAVPHEHRRLYVVDETGEYLQCSCGIRDYLDAEYDQ